MCVLSCFVWFKSVLLNLLCVFDLSFFCCCRTPAVNSCFRFVCLPTYLSCSCFPALVLQSFLPLLRYVTLCDWQEANIRKPIYQLLPLFYPSPRAHLHVVGMVRFMSDTNQPSLPTPFYSVLVSISVFMALSTVFHSICSPDNSPFSHPVLPYWSFHLYISLWQSPSALI